MLKTLFFLIFLIGMLSIPVAFKRLTEGFRLAKLQLEYPTRSEWEVAMPAEVEQILQQPFFYLGRGTQCYAFVSADGNSVLKLFRYDHPPFNPLRRKRASLREKVETLFSACNIAYSLGKEETGLLYIHLNPTEAFLLTATLHLPLGRVVELPLHRYRFALQKRAKTCREAFQAAYAKGDKEEARKLFHSLIELFQKRQKKGIWNLDLNLSRNFGFIEGKAVELDFGRYVFAGEEGLCLEREEFDHRLFCFITTVVPAWSDLLEER